MPEISSADRRSAQGRHAAAVRWRKPNADQLAAELAEARLAEYVERVVASAPPLRPEQVDRIVALLKGAA